MAQLSTKALDLLTHPAELWAAARLVFSRRDLNALILAMPPNKKYCYDMLVLVSRSFAAVIMELQEELRDAVRCAPRCLCRSGFEREGAGVVQAAGS